jgi:enoyl-CoA hydratase/carnithine racemase
MSGSAGPLHLERDGDVAVVVLDNPPVNLFDELVFEELERIAGELVRLTEPGRDDRARAVLVEARGRHVSAGVDVGLFQEIADGPQAVARGTALWARLLRAAQTVEELPVPTVFAAHGLTLTAAF